MRPFPSRAARLSSRGAWRCAHPPALPSSERDDFGAGFVDSCFPRSIRGTRKSCPSGSSLPGNHLKRNAAHHLLNLDNPQVRQILLLTICETVHPCQPTLCHTRTPVLSCSPQVIVPYRPGSQKTRPKSISIPVATGIRRRLSPTILTGVVASATASATTRHASGTVPPDMENESQKPKRKSSGRRADNLPEPGQIEQPTANRLQNPTACHLQKSNPKGAIPIVKSIL